MPRTTKQIPPGTIQAEALRQRQARFLRTGTHEKHFTVRMRADEWGYIHGVAIEIGCRLRRLFEDGLNCILGEHREKPFVGFSEKPE